jgi:hypothetical protein
LFAQCIVCFCGYQKLVAYLWLNVIGCLLVILAAVVLQFLINKKAAAQINVPAA